MPLVRKPRGGRLKGHHSEEDESTPICRCRVLYLGSAVPHITKDGLQGIQEPLKELYPDTGLTSLKGIDSWLSVWSNGLLLENVDEKNTKITRFFPIESLHYCAAVRNVLVPASSDGGSSNEKIQKFLPLDSPFARLPNLNHPPLFACILRRTTGIKVLECHAFICKREMAANALVRCCFHAYGDSTYAKHLENGGGGGGTLPLNSNGFATPMNNGNNGNNGMTNGTSNGTLFKDPDRQIQRSVTPLNSIEKVTGWQAVSHNGDGPANSTDDDFTDGPVSTSTPRNNKYEFSAEFPDEDEIYEGDENHKIWGGSTASGLNGTSELVYLEPDGTLTKSIKSHNSRLSKPRQFISPPPPPPPPPQQFSLLKSAEDDASSTKKKTKKKTKKEMKLTQQQQQQMAMQQQQQQHAKYLMRPASMLNLSSVPNGGGGGGLQPGMSPGRAGSVMNGPISHRPGSAMSTLTRPRPGHMHGPQLIPVPQHMNGYGNGYGMMMHPHHPPMMHQPIYGHLSPPFAVQPPPLVKGSKSKNKKQQQMLTQVPLLAPTPLHHPHPGMHHPGLHHPHPHHHSHHSQQQQQQQQQLHHHHHHHPGGPSPMNMNMNMNGPTPPPMYHHHHQQQQHHHAKMMEQQQESSSKQGGSKHSEMMMLPSQYATIERGYHYHHNSTRLMNGHGGGGGSVMMMRNGDSATLTSTKSKSKGGGMHNTVDNGGEENGSSSPFNTGIYRKKGHLNERAFSYSIRQEHRSRSYGSLANLQFANESGGQLARPSGSPPTAEGMKKEREIIQMVRDLDLSGDEIERSQVPPEMYPSKKMNGYHHRPQNGVGSHGPRITHR